MNPLNDNDIQYAGHPEQAPRPDPLVPEPQRRPPRDPFRKFRLIMIGAGVAAVLVIVVAIVVMTLARSSTVKTDEKKKTDETKVAHLTAAETIKHVNVYFKGKEKAKSSITTPVRVKGRKFYTVVPDLDQVQSLAGYVPKDKSTSQRESIEKNMDYDGFTRKVFSEGSRANYLADFTRDDVTCQLSTDISQRDKLGDWMEIRCLDTKVYAEYAEAQQPVVSVYTPAVSAAGQYGFIGKPAPFKGALKGYQLLEIPVSTVLYQRMTAPDNLGLFYQTPDGLWHYFQDRNRNILVACTLYNNRELRMAYADQKCQSIGGSTKDTVTYSGKRD